ncbi:hypothetical protein Tco_0090517 [Tanacetum coccineum]
MTKNLEEYRFVGTTLKQRTDHKDLQNCLFACFLSQEEPKKVIHALKDPRWIEAIQYGIRVNAGDSKLMLLGINLLLLGKVNAARHTLTIARESYCVAFLEKPTESVGFEEIVDFLNANPIKYALTDNPTIYSSCIKQFWDTIKTKTVNGEIQLQALVDRKKVIITESTIRRDLQLDDAEAQEEMGEGSANPIDPYHTPIITQPSTSQPQKKQKPRKPKIKDSEIPQSSGPTEPIADEAVNEENIPTHSNVYCLVELEIESLKRRVKKLEKKKRSRTHKLKRLYKVGLSAKVVSSDNEASLGDQEDASKQGRKIHDIDADEDITLDNTHFNTNPDMFGVHDINGDEVFIEIEEPVVNAATTISIIPVSAAKYLSNVDITLAQALAELKNTRPKAKGLVMQEKEPMASTPITSSKDKGKGIMVEEPLKMKKKDQVLFDKQEAIRLQAQFDKEDTIAREKEEVNAALIGQWNDIQDKVKKEEEKRNRPPTKAQQRSLMSTYLKNMARWKPRDLKNKNFTNIQELFDKAMKRVNTFVDMDIELVEGSEVKQKAMR